MGEQGSIGFFGKIPSAGDFVQRQLPVSFVEAWDAHFEKAIADLRQRLDTRWSQAFAGAPAWRFVLAPGVMGASAWAGLFGPSSDRVGRHFPLVLAGSLAQGPGSAVRLLDAGHAWFDRLQALYVATQDRHIDVERLAASLSQLDRPSQIVSRDVIGVLRSTNWGSSARWSMALSEAPASGAWLAELWTQLAATASPWCLWWRLPQPGDSGCALVTHGLPDGESLLAFTSVDVPLEGNRWATPRGLERGGRMASGKTPANPDARAATMSGRGVAVEDDMTLPVSSAGEDRTVPAPAVMSVDDTLPACAASRPETPVSGPRGGSVARAERIEARGGQLQVIVVDDGPPMSPRRASVLALDVARRWASQATAPQMTELGEALMSVHRSLRESAGSSSIVEDGVVVAFHTDGTHLECLRIGSAIIWLKRGDVVRQLTEVPASANDADDLDDLLNGAPAPVSPGLGASVPPGRHILNVPLQRSDRLLVLATRTLVDLGGEVIHAAMRKPQADQVAVHVAHAGGLGDDPSTWPIAVIEVSS